MAETVNDTRVVRRGSTLSNAFALFALLLAIAALLFALRAHNQSQRALQQLTTANDKIIRLTSRLDDALGKNTISSPGGGTGPNNTVTPASGNTVPNGNGQ